VDKHARGSGHRERNGYVAAQSKDYLRHSNQDMDTEIRDPGGLVRPCPRLERVLRGIRSILDVKAQNSINFLFFSFLVVLDRMELCSITF